MSSRRKAGNRRAPARRPSLRQALAVERPVLSATTRTSAADETIALCQRWFQLRAETERLQNRWGEVEAWLDQHEGWCTPDLTGRPGLPESREMDEIDAQLDDLMAQSQALLQLLPGLAARTPAAIAAKLQVAAKLVWPIDNPQAHRLVVAAARDVAALEPCSTALGHRISTP